MVLVYGLAVAPVLHAVVGHGGEARIAHAGHVHEGASHRHDGPGAEGHLEHEHGAAHPGDGHGKGPGQHEHAPGSVEHLWALAVAKAEVLPPVPVWVALREVLHRAPTGLPGARLRPTAMPQGP